MREQRKSQSLKNLVKSSLFWLYFNLKNMVIFRITTIKPFGLQPISESFRYWRIVPSLNLVGVWK